MAQTFDKKAYQKEYMATVYEKAKKLGELYGIFKKNAKVLIKAGLSDEDKAILKEVEKLVDMG
jgi:hypothetical protein